MKLINKNLKQKETEFELSSQRIKSKFTKKVKIKRLIKSL
jgi:hypothetical protein